ncbi:MAG: hypothetical protein PUE47_07455, partial [Lachnospiraceae bacterium]|nr:hypothetical protein [Lachnospiraceae bacterium]
LSAGADACSGKNRTILQDQKSLHIFILSSKLLLTFTFPCHAKACPVLHASMRPVLLCDWTYAVKREWNPVRISFPHYTSFLFSWHYPDSGILHISFLKKDRTSV